MIVIAEVALVSDHKEADLECRHGTGAMQNIAQTIIVNTVNIWYDNMHDVLALLSQRKYL